MNLEDVIVMVTSLALPVLEAVDLINQLQFQDKKADGLPNFAAADS